MSQVFTAAAADERKNIVLLAFETMEKIVREYFPYITETETTTFTDCVRCLITFTNSRFNSDVSLNAIAFLRFCAVKLAEGGLVCYEMTGDNVSSSTPDAPPSIPVPTDKDDYASYWVPLLAGETSVKNSIFCWMRCNYFLYNTCISRGTHFLMHFSGNFCRGNKIL